MAKKRKYYDISGVVLDTKGNQIGTMNVPTVSEREKKQRQLEKEDMLAARTRSQPKLLQTIDTTQSYKQTKKNLKKADDILTQKTNVLNDKEAAIYKAAGQKFTPEFKDLSKEMLNYADKEKQNTIQTAIPEQKITPEEVGKQTKKEQKEYMKALNNWKIANYQNNFAKAQEKPTTLFDKTLGVPIRATQDFFSPLASDTGILRDEQGNETYLPSYADMRQQKVRQDTKGVAGFAQDVAYNTTKMADAALVDALTGGVGGKMLYWGDMAHDNYKNAINKGAKNEQAIANTIISTGSEFLTEKLLGGVSKALTGGKTSSVQKGLANAVNKLMKNPKYANILGSMGAEGAEEFVQEFIDAANNTITLGEDLDLEQTLKDAAYSFAVGAGSGGAMTSMNNAEGRAIQNNYNDAGYSINELNAFKNNITNQDTIKQIDEAVQSARQYQAKPFTANINDTIEKMQNFNEVEMENLIDITNRRKAGEKLTQKDYAALRMLNDKYGMNEDVQQDMKTNEANKQVQKIKRAVESGKMTVQDGIAEIQNITNSLTGQNAQENTPTQVETTHPNAIAQETQNVAQQPNKTVNEYQEPTARQMTPEEVEEMNRVQTESLNRMAETEGYNKETPGEQLVQNNNVSDRKVKAVQYENPEIKPYYKEMAKFIADEAHEGANMAYEGGLIQDDSGYGAPDYRRYGGWNGLLGEVDKFAKENNMTARQVEKAAQDIIEDNGKENNANAKKVEQLIDKRLRNGFTYMGDRFEPNQDYINKMEEIAFENQRQNDLEALGDRKANQQIQTTNKSRNMFSTVAPFYSQQVNDANYEGIRETVENRFTKEARSIAENLGIGIKNIQNNIGGYSFDDGAGRVDELSYTYQLDENTTPKQAKMFGCLLGDIGNEVQESIVVGNYTDMNDVDANLEYTLKLDSSDGIIDILKKAGITDYTFNKQKNELQLLLFKDNGRFNENEILEQFEKLNKELGGRINEPTKNYISSELVESEDRQNLYEEWLESNRGTKNRKLYNQVQKAYQKVKQFNENKRTSDSSFSNENKVETKSENVKAEKTLDDAIKEFHYAKKETNEKFLRIDDNGNAKMSDEMPKILDKVQKNDRKVDIGTVVDTGMRLLVNKGHNIDKVAKANGINRLKTSYDRTLAVGQEGQNQIKRAQTDLRGKEYNNFKVKDKNGNIVKKNLSYMGIWEDAEKSGVPTKVLEEYAVNKLNLDRRASGNETWEEQFPNMTEEYSKKVTKEIERLYSNIKRCHGNLTQYYANIREKMVDSGILSKNSKEYYDMNTPNYVPIQKAVGRRGSSVSSTQNAEGVKTYNQKKIKGGNFDIQPLRETGAQFTLDTLATMRKNIVGQQLGKLIAPEYDLEAAELGENYNQETAKKIGKGEYTLTYFENGEAKTIPIDSGIYHAMTNPQISEGLKLAGEINQKYGAGLISRAQRGLLTDKNAYFILTNFFKDIGDAPLNSKHTAKFVKNYPLMIVDLGGKGPYSTLWKNLGGVASSYFKDGEFVGERQYKSKVGKAINAVGKGVDWALTPIEVGNNFVEQLPRLTEFKSTIEANGYEVTADGDVVPMEGKNPTKSVDEVLDEAMYNSAEITTNFKRGGTLTKMANRNGATFLNASVQGFDKFIRNFTDVVDTSTGKPKINSKAAVKLILKAAIFGVSTSMINDAMNGDDDDYKDIPEYQKDSYYLFNLGNHKWLRIPKGRMASIFGDAARRTKNAMTGDDKAFEGFLQQIQNQIAPNSVFTDNVLSGFSAVKNNKSWSGNQIVSDWEKNDEHPEDEYDAKTDEFSKWLGKKLGKSPKKINYLLDQYSGVVGDIALPMMTKYTNTPINSKLGKALLAPLSNKFTTSDIMSNKSQSKFYDEYNKTKDQVSHNQKIGKENDKTTIKSKYLGDQNKKLAELKTKITKVQESDMSNKEKIKKVEKLQKQINDISKKSLETSKKVKVDDYLATAGKNIYVKDDKGKWRAETDKTKEKRKELGLDVEDYYYYKKDEAFEKPDGKTVSIVDGKNAKDQMALVDAFGFDPSDYLKYQYEIGQIKSDKNSKGKTIRNSQKNKVIKYISELQIPAEQKAVLYKKKGYKSSKYDSVVINSIRNSNLTAEERESLASFLKIK